MALADFAAYKAAISGPWQHCYVSKNNQGTIAAAPLISTYSTAPYAANLPGTAANVTSPAQNASVLGLISMLNSTGTARLAQAEMQVGQPSLVWLVDRIAHSSGTTSTGTQAYTWPALPTRYSAGAGLGVFAAVEIYTAPSGTLAAPLSMSYTNSAGVSGRTSGGVLFGGGASGAIRSGSTLTILPLQEGDYGVQSIASYTMGALSMPIYSSGWTNGSTTLTVTSTKGYPTTGAVTAQGATGTFTYTSVTTTTFVASVAQTLSGTPAGTASALPLLTSSVVNSLGGTLGITTFKIIAMFPIMAASTPVLWDSMIGGGGNMPQIPADACLMLASGGSPTASGIIQIDLRLIET